MSIERLSEQLTAQLLTRPAPTLHQPRNTALPPEQTIELRARLQSLLDRAPQGTKTAIAEVLGYRGRWRLSSLRGLAKGRTKLFNAQIRRITRILDATGDDPREVARLGSKFRSRSPEL